MLAVLIRGFSFIGNIKAIKTWLAFTTDTSMRTRENADRLVTLGEDALDYGRSSANSYANAGDARHAYEAYPYVLLALQLSGQDRSTVATMFVEAYQGCGKYGSLWAQMQMWIIMEKLRLLNSEQLEGRRITETSALGIAYVDVSPYLYAEMLGMSAIYDKLPGVPNKGKLEQIRAAYIDIGREDRWDVLTSALESLPDDMQVYMQHMAYMLLP